MVTEEVKIGSSTLENFLVIFTEIKLYLPHEPIILLLGIYQEEWELKYTKRFAQEYL